MPPLHLLAHVGQPIAVVVGPADSLQGDEREDALVLRLRRWPSPDLAALTVPLNRRLTEGQHAGLWSARALATLPAGDWIEVLGKRRPDFTCVAQGPR